MVLKSFAKINLSLNINKKLKNGLHNIQSIYCMINLNDEISIKKNKYKDRIQFVGPFSNNVSHTNNSIKNIFKILRKNKLISDFYNVKISKKIPVFSGLGGGTSNAASVLKFILKKKTKKKIFDKFSKYVGSDLKLFYFKQGYQKNLNEIYKFKKNYNLNFLLAYPKIKCSTKDIFARVKNYSRTKKLLSKNLDSKTKFINYLIYSKNDLQFIVEKKHPIVKKLLKNISKSEGCFFSRMTGSGSVCYGLFANKNCSKVALKKLRKKYPKFWFSIAKTI